jgi:hypothetical protein
MMLMAMTEEGEARGQWRRLLNALYTSNQAANGRGPPLRADLEEAAPRGWGQTRFVSCGEWERERATERVVGADPRKGDATEMC